MVRALTSTVFAALLWGCGSGATGPMLTPGEHHFGLVTHGQRVDHTWLLSAAVPRPFQVRYTRVPCSCAFPRLIVTAKDGKQREAGWLPRDYPFPVAAGEKLELKLQFDSGKKLARDWEENFQTVVFTDLPEQPEVTFKFQAQIQVPLLLTPGPEVDLGALNEHQTATTTVTLAPRDGHRFKVLDVVGLQATLTPEGPVDHEVPLAGIRLTPTELADGALRYVVESPPGREYAEDGRFVRRVLFKTDLPDHYGLEVQFRAMRVPAITIEPVDKLSFSRISADQPSEQTLTLKQNLPGPLFTATVDRIEMAVEGKPVAVTDELRVRIEPLPAVRSVRLIARYEKPFAGRYFRGRIHLKTDLAETPTLFVEVVGFHDR